MDMVHTVDSCLSLPIINGVAHVWLRREKLYGTTFDLGYQR